MTTGGCFSNLFISSVCQDYGRDEDHLALMMELMGKMPKKLALAGKYSSESFNKKGELKHIKKLNSWPMDKVSKSGNVSKFGHFQVLTDKYNVAEEDAHDLSELLTGVL